MKRQIAVIGIGKFGYKIVEELAEKGMSVLALDRNRGIIEKLKDFTVEAMQIDTLDKNALEASGVKDADAVIVALGTEVESSILITKILHDLGVKEIVARAKSRLHARILEQVGATRVVFPEEDMAIRVANSMMRPSIREYFELGGDFDLAEIEVKGGHNFIGKKLSSLSIEKTYNVSLVIIKKCKAEKNKEGISEICESKQIPSADYTVVAGDILVVIGDKKDIERFGEIF